MMANGIARKRIESLVPRKTSWRLARKFLTKPTGTFETRAISDFFRREDDDMLWAVRPCLVSLLKHLWFPFSNSHASVLEAILETRPATLTPKLFLKTNCGVSLLLGIMRGCCFGAVYIHMHHTSYIYSHWIYLMQLYNLSIIRSYDHTILWREKKTNKEPSSWLRFCPLGPAFLLSIKFFWIQLCL